MRSRISSVRVPAVLLLMVLFAAPAFAQLPVSGWPGRFREWMTDMGFLTH